MSVRAGIEGLLGKLFKIGLGSDEVSLSADAGNLGINQPTPTGTLHVVAGSGATTGVIVESPGGPSAPPFEVRETSTNVFMRVSKNAQVSLSGGSFASEGDSQGRLLVVRRVTTNATTTELTLDGGAPTASNVIQLADDSTILVRVAVVARRTDADNESAGYRIEAVLDRNTGAGTTALVAAIDKKVIAEDQGPWDCDVVANTTDGALRVNVTGQAGKTIRWVAFIRLTEVRG